MAISQPDIYTLAISAGLTPARAKIASAVAWAETKGDPQAHNTKGRDNSYGLWQINMKGALGPERLKLLKLTSADQLFDPQTNARAMAVISKDGQDFTPWSTYVDLEYVKYLKGWSSGAAAGTTPGVIDAGFWDRLKSGGGKLLDVIPGPADLLTPFRDFAQIIGVVVKTAAWLSNSDNWVRIAYVGGGVALAGLGTMMVLSDTRAGRAVGQGAGALATTISPTARIGTAVKAAKAAA